MLQIGRIVLEVLGFGRLALTGAEALLTTWFLAFMKGGEFDNIMRQAWPCTGNSVADFVGGLISSIVVAIVIPFVLLATMAVPAIALSALTVAGILGSGAHSVKKRPHIAKRNLIIRGLPEVRMSVKTDLKHSQQNPVTGLVCHHNTRCLLPL